MEETKQKPKKLHNVQIENRAKAILSGIEEVGMATETQITLTTSAGGFTLSGRGMHITKYNADEGLLVAEGEIIGLDYSEAKKKGMFKRLFK